MERFGQKFVKKVLNTIGRWRLFDSPDPGMDYIGSRSFHVPLAKLISSYASLCLS